MVKHSGWADLVSTVLMTVAVVAVGGLFTSGATASLPLLSFLPAIVHTVAGWGLIIGAVAGVALKYLKL